MSESKYAGYIKNTTCVHIPKGLAHTPRELKRIGQPIVFMDIALISQYVRKPADSR